MSREGEHFEKQNIVIYDAELAEKFSNPSINNIRVQWIGDPDKNWLISENHIGVKPYNTKQEAIKAGRKLAKEKRPAVLIIGYKKDSNTVKDG